MDISNMTPDDLALFYSSLNARMGNIGDQLRDSQIAGDDMTIARLAPVWSELGDLMIDVSHEMARRVGVRTP